MPAASSDAAERPLWREILILAWPAALQNLLQSAMFFIDTRVIGYLPIDPSGSHPLAAMQLCGPLVWSSTVISGFFVVGTTAVVARAVGERDLAKARRATAISMRLAIVVALVAALAGFLAAEPLMRAYGGSAVHPQTIADASSFLKIFAVGFPLHLLVLTQMSALRGAGDTLSPMAAGILANLLNAVGNIALILGAWGCPAIGVPGAAVATVLATAFEAVLLTFFLVRGGIRTGKSTISLTLPLRAFTSWDASMARSILTVSLPALGEAVATHSAFLAFQKSINHMSETAMAAHRIAITLESLAFMPAFGLYVACAAYAGQRLGEGRSDLAERGVRWTATRGAALFCVLSALFAGLPEILAGMFLEVPGTPQDLLVRNETITASAVCLRLAALEIPLIAAAMALYGGLRGAGETKGPLWVSLVGGWLLRVPLSYGLGLSLGWGLAGVWTATVLDWTVRTALYLRLLARERWKKIAL